MYDFWYAIGVAIIKYPGLLDAIHGANPVFDFLQRIVIEIGPDGKRNLRPSSTTSGVLENIPTTSVRKAMAKFVKNFAQSAPPVGIYTAGRFCQLIKIPRFDGPTPKSTFRDIISYANQGYVKALNGGPKATVPTFPAFLGLCLMDGKLAYFLIHPDAHLTEILQEFGIGLASRDLQIATAFVQTQEFKQATNLFMLGDSNPWQIKATPEQIFFWDQFSEHAIL